MKPYIAIFVELFLFRYFISTPPIRYWGGNGLGQAQAPALNHPRTHLACAFALAIRGWRRCQCKRHALMSAWLCGHSFPSSIYSGSFFIKCFLQSSIVPQDLPVTKRWRKSQPLTLSSLHFSTDEAFSTIKYLLLSVKFDLQESHSSKYPFARKDRWSVFQF